MDDIDDPIFEIIPRSTATQQPPEKPAPYGIIQTRLRQILGGSTARVPSQELLKKVYTGCRKPSLNALEQQIGVLNDTLRAEGSTWEVTSTNAYGQCAPGEGHRKPRKNPGGSFDPST